jgi:uracil permease
MLQFTIGKDFTFSLGGVALATLVGIILNLVIPNTKKVD